MLRREARAGRHAAPRCPSRHTVGLAFGREATALAIENMHDRPYLKGGVGPEITAAMTVVAREVKREAGLALGIQVLAGANREALAIAHASGADFVRVEGFVYAHVADEGVIESRAGDLLRYRRAIGAERVLILADIKKKHSAHAMTADVSLVETAKAAEFFLADGVIVTGPTTGEAASFDEVRDVARAPAESRQRPRAGPGVFRLESQRVIPSIVLLGSRGSPLRRHHGACGGRAAPLVAWSRHGRASACALTRIYLYRYISGRWKPYSTSSRSRTAARS